MDKNDIKKKIAELKEQRDAIIVAHNYQIDEIQEISDVIGDSLTLSKYCTKSTKKVIVFCGVHFMAESAKILSPEKTVLLPEIDAGCPMADMVTVEELREAKKKHPEAVVVCYINSSAEVKAESDICCTSSNAVQVVKSIKEKDILFVPDQNLANYVAKMVPEKNIISWPGYCITHHRLKLEDVKRVRELYKDAELLIHPESPKEVVDEADFVGSTKQIIEYASKSESKKFVIGTEMGIMYKLKKDNPDKTFYLLSQGLICPNMKKNTLISVYNALNEMKYEINIDENIRVKAKETLDRMHKIQL